MSSLWLADELIEAMGGRPIGAMPQAVTGISIDTRSLVPGDAFFAIRGEAMDGHDFATAAVKAGASLLVIAEGKLPALGRLTAPMIVVPDVLAALEKAGVAARARTKAKIIAVTGSAGKTTTKDLLAGILATQGQTVAPQGSYNGEIGVPLTVFRAGTDTRYLVIEMGATGIGHIRYLAEMVKPDIGVVLAVGTAHAGEFGGVENIALAKGELVEALAPSGTAVVNLDDERVAAMRARTSASVLGFSAEGRGDAAVQALNADTNAGGHPEFDLQLPDGETGLHVSSRLIGVHHIGNLLAAAAAAWAAGVPGQAIAKSLSSQTAASRWRMERTERADGVTIINDAYNANPESMRAALRTLADLGRGRRTWAVLGAMLELGEDSIREHTAVGTQVVRLNISRLLVVGREARALYVSAVQEGSWGDECLFAETAEEAYELLDSELQPGDLVLFKSSNSVGLRHLGDRIALPRQTPQPADERSTLL
jgi:UDP-N-acetylmuramoyl-tripeptide--D-alanyl-D-alanine ligase